jgi:hypothetical protein
MEFLAYGDGDDEDDESSVQEQPQIPQVKVTDEVTESVAQWLDDDEDDDDSDVEGNHAGKDAKTEHVQQTSIGKKGLASEDALPSAADLFDTVSAPKYLRTFEQSMAYVAPTFSKIPEEQSDHKKTAKASTQPAMTTKSAGQKVKESATKPNVEKGVIGKANKEKEDLSAKVGFRRFVYIHSNIM